MYVIAKELIGAPGMPATTKGIRQALQNVTYKGKAVVPVVAQALKQLNTASTVYLK